MYLIVKEVHKTLKRPIYVHCAGHSLGGQSCGFAGKYLNADPDPDAKEMDRISGMDPAGPLFCNDVPYPFDYLDIKPEARLGPHDAKLVDVIHTDGDARYLGILPQVSSQIFVNVHILHQLKHCSTARWSVLERSIFILEAILITATISRAA